MHQPLNSFLQRLPMIGAIVATSLAALTFTGASLAATLEFSGVKVEDSAMVAGTKLQLNGAGIRYKGPFKVYVGDLYTTKKVGSLDELAAAPGPKRLTMTFLREMEAGPFGKLLTRGVEDNVPKNEVSKLIPGLLRMSDIFTVNKVLLPGETVTIDWIPGTGMVITAKGKVQGEPFKEPEFFKSIMSIWLGPVPADFKLKDALLGIK
jgi:Chalcone isomerase-like